MKLKLIALVAFIALILSFSLNVKAMQLPAFVIFSFSMALTFDGGARGGSGGDGGGDGGGGGGCGGGCGGGE